MEPTAGEIYPIKVKIKLKRSCNVGMNQWHCTILNELRAVTTDLVEYYCKDIEDAAQSFRKTEVEYVVITGHYGRD